MSQDPWSDRLLAYLHDPPDKAVDIPGHVARACRYAGTALNETVEPHQLKLKADMLASVVERFPAPHWTHLKVGPDGDRLLIKHPLSGKSRELTGCVLDEAWVIKVIRETVAGLGDDRRGRMLALWRLLPERLAAESHAWLAQAPADTRVPDHTIWQHLDITTGLQAAEQGNRGPALLSFALGPVQSFIAMARSVRDLWTGSMILSYLTFRAMVPIILEQGPTALVYPSLRGIPLLDLWLGKDEQLRAKLSEISEDLRRAPCLPNRFVAVVPWGAGGEHAGVLAAKCRTEAERAWKDLAESVRSKLAEAISASPQAQGWDRRWDDQIGSFFDFRTSVLPLSGSREEVEGRLADLLSGRETFGDAFPKADRVRELARAIHRAGHAPGYDQEHAGRWQYQVELSVRLMQARRTIRPVPTYEGGSPAPLKCSLMGSYEQLGPDQLEESRRFWQMASRTVDFQGVRLREGERFCAVALVKRFAAPAVLAKELKLQTRDLRFDDVSSVAAARWFKDYPDLRAYAERQRSSSWLYWARPNQEQEEGEERVPQDVWNRLLDARRRERPPAYYAVLMMDGDQMGAWLRGAKSPQVQQLMHPDTVAYFKKLGQATEEGLKVPRPVGPALHAAISEALANFALHFVPRIVKKHHGTLIYAGGDDVLALLPTSTVLDCAGELRETFRHEWRSDESGRERLLMGESATVSAGIAVVHVKEDLRMALQAARNAEKQAKDAGRDALQIMVCRRSGEHSSVLCPWPDVGQVQAWVEAFRQGASDRWAYHLAAELPTLCGLAPEAMHAEIRRQVQRAEEPTRNLLAGTDGRNAGQFVAGFFERYRLAEYSFSDGSVRRRFAVEALPDDSKAVTHFVKLCQTASFLARGRDR